MRCHRVIFASIAICAVAFFSGCQRSRPVDDSAIINNVKARLTAVFGPIERRQVVNLSEEPTNRR